METLIFTVVLLCIYVVNVVGTLYIKVGKDVVLSWTLNPLPESSSPIIAVKNGADQNLFTVFYSTNAPTYGDASGNRITYNGTISTGQMSFVVQNVQVLDGGTYKAIVLEKTSTGPTLAIIAKPSQPNIQHTTVPVVGLSFTLKCSSTSNSVPISESFAMSYTWNVPSKIAYTASGSTITVTTIVLSYNGSSVTCTAQDSGGTPVIYSDVSDNSVPYVIYPLYGPQSSPSLSHTSPQTSIESTDVPVITCNDVQCNPVCNYTWRKQGQSTVSSVSNRLNLGKADRSDRGTYYCTVANSYGSRNSNDFEINVLYGPNTPSLNRSSPVTVEQGRQVPSITCTADCNPGCSYTWTKRGQGTVTTQNGILSLGNADRSEDGTYYCMARNTYGTQNSADIEIDVQYGPNTPSLDQSSPVIVEQGKQVPSITCTADCNPGCSYTWTKRGQGTVTSQNGVLSFGNADRSEDGTYYCTARNTHGTQNSADIEIDVQYRPGEIIMTPVNRSYTILENTTVGDIRCSAECNPSCTYKWNGINTDVLQLGEVTRQKAGTYVCNASNAIGYLTDMVTVIVNYPPHITDLSRSGGDQIMEGDNFMIECTVDSHPQAAITWSYRYNSSMVSVLETSATNRNVLNFANVKCTQTGTYICNADNGIQSSDRKEIDIRVFCSPRLDTSDSGNKNVSKIGLGDNQDLKIATTFIAYPVPDIVWMFKNSLNESNQTLQNGTDHVMISTEKYTYSATTELIKTQISKGDFGNYTAVATNELGTSSAVFVIIPERKPDVSQQLQVLCKNHHEAEISWIPGFDGGDTQSFSIEYGKISGKKETVQSRMKDEQQKNVSDIVSGLEPNIVYSFRVIASNIHGSVTSVEVVNCTTKPLQENGTEGAVIGAVSGSLVGIIVIVVVVVIIVLLRRQKTGAKRKDNDLNGKLALAPRNEDHNDDNEDGMRDNILYESAGPDYVPPGAQGATGGKNDYLYADVQKQGKKSSNDNPAALYAEVQKKPPKEDKNVPVDPSAVYAEVQKSNKEGKGAKPKTFFLKPVGGKQNKGAKKKAASSSGDQGTVYENVEDLNTGRKVDVYANSDENPGPTSSEKKHKKQKGKKPEKKNINKDGLIYADLELDTPPKQGKKFVIRGLENKTDYAEVDFSQKADPLPPNEDDNAKQQEPMPGSEQK